MHMFAEIQLQVTMIRMACKGQRPRGKERGQRGIYSTSRFREEHLVGSNTLGDSENNRIGFSNSIWACYDPTRPLRKQEL